MTGWTLRPSSTGSSPRTAPRLTCAPGACGLRVANAHVPWRRLLSPPVHPPASSPCREICRNNPDSRISQCTTRVGEGGRRVLEAGLLTRRSRVRVPVDPPNDSERLDAVEATASECPPNLLPHCYLRVTCTGWAKELVRPPDGWRGGGVVAGRGGGARRDRRASRWSVSGRQGDGSSPGDPPRPCARGSARWRGGGDRRGSGQREPMGGTAGLRG